MKTINKLGKALLPFVLAGASIFCGVVPLSGCTKMLPTITYKSPPLEKRISQEIAKPNNRPDKYAVLISGITEEKYAKNLSLAYQTLCENGFEKENIYILDRKGEQKYDYPVDAFARKESINRVFEHLERKIDNQDLLFIYMTDHGNVIKKKVNISGKIKKIELSTLNLLGPSLDQKEFASYLRGISPRHCIFLVDQCHSGGFANEIGKGNCLAIASSEGKSYSGINHSVGGYFMLAFKNPKESDLNKDGKVSIKEAFDYMAERHIATKNKKQTPSIKGDLDPNEVFLN